MPGRSPTALVTKIPSCSWERANRAARAGVTAFPSRWNTWHGWHAGNYTEDRH